MAEVRRTPRFAKLNGVLYPAQFSLKCFQESMEYKPRTGDVIISTYPKCGTTWIHSVAMYIFRKGKELDNPSDFLRCAPYIDALGQEGIDRMPKPGALKTHLPYSRMPYSPDAKHVFVARNPKDCCVSLYHHLRSNPGFGYWDAEFDDFFELFMAGEVQYNDYFDHLLDWYPHRNDTNVFYTTYEDMKKDIKDIILRLSKFLGQEYIDAIEKDNNVLNNIIHFTEFQYMKKRFDGVWAINKRETNLVQMYTGLKHQREYAKSLNPPQDLQPPQFIRNGIVGDWKTYFSAEQEKRLNSKFLDKMKDTEVINWYPIE